MYKEAEEYSQDIQFKIGQRIQEARIAKGIAGVDLAEILGIGKNQLSRIENGRANCTVPQLFVLAQVLECSVDYILFGKEQGRGFSKEQILAIEVLFDSIKNSG